MRPQSSQTWGPGPRSPPRHAVPTRLPLDIDLGSGRGAEISSLKLPAPQAQQPRFRGPQYSGTFGENGLGRHE